MWRYYSIILTLLLFAPSCKKDKCSISPFPVLIRLVDVNNTDLLDPSNPGSYDFVAIKLYYVENNQEKRVPISLNQYQVHTYILAADFARHALEGRDFYLELSSTDTDTLYSKFEYSGQTHCSYYKELTFKYNHVTQYLNKLNTGNQLVYQVKK